jgi:hypothetical protein
MEWKSRRAVLEKVQRYCDSGVEVFGTLRGKMAGLLELGGK